MKKSYFLGLAMLLGVTGEGYAQVKIATFAELKAAKDSVAKVGSYNEALADAKSTYNSLVAGAMGIKPTETTTKTEYFKKGRAEKDAINTYYNDVTSGNTGSNSKLRISRVSAGTGIFAGTKIYIYAPNQKAVEDQTVVDISVNENWTETSTIISGDKKINSIICYVAGRPDNEGNITYEEVISPLTAKPTLDLALLDEIVNAATKIQIENEPYEITTTTKNEAYLSAKQQIAANETLQSYYNAALNGGKWTIKTVAWNAEGTDVAITNTESEYIFPGCINYKNLKLASEIVIDETGFTMGNMGSDYIFDGGDFNITLNGTTLFGTNNGRISNIVATGGNLATTNIGTITNVTMTDGNVVEENNGNISNATVSNGSIAKTKGGNSHITNSIETKDQTSIVYGSDASSATVNAADASTYYNIYNNKTLRDEFGVAVTNGIVSKGSNNKLYEVKMYHADKKEGETRIANIDGNGKPVIKRSWTKNDAGEFYYISDTDAGSLFDGITGDNIAKNVVYTHDGNNWECKVAEVSNGANSIYIPRAFTAAKVEYNRTFTVKAENASTICLPFAVSEDKVASVLGANGHLLQFNKIDENGMTYWFKYVTGGIVANQPYVLLFGKDVNSAVFNDLNLEDVVFAATGENQDLKALAQSAEASGASLYGTFEKRTASELEDGAKYSIYGFQNGKFVRMTETVNFNATRAYVRGEWTDVNVSSAKSYNLGILDEDDNVVTGINTVENTDGRFTVNGGNGMINITSEKAQVVRVYTVNGALVKSMDVKGGATSIDVPAGMYIVNGNKVVVK